MKNKEQKHEKVEEKTFSYYACKNIITAFDNSLDNEKFKEQKKL